MSYDDPDDARVLGILGRGPRQVGDLIHMVGMPTSPLLTILARLERKGLVVRGPDLPRHHEWRRPWKRTYRLAP